MEEENPQVEQPQSDPTPATDNTIAIIAYITVIGLIIAIIMNQEKKNEFASYHIRQALGVFATLFVLGLVAVIPILGWIIFILGWLFTVVIWIMGLVNAIGGKMKPVPVLGEKYADWFKGVN